MQVPVMNICDRTPAVLNEIKQLVDKDHCAEISDEDLAKITSMYIGTDNTTSLLVGDFSGLTNLQSLGLDGNISTLPSGILGGLTSLQDLLLGGNISTLPSGILVI